MCGIAGTIGRGGDDAVRRMLAAMAHRGPDDEGVHASAHASLGSRRLSIIDLAGGHQPIANEKGDVVVVQNGEIYNYRELRSELEALGCRFRTESDTEAILRGFEVWGIDVAARLRGMFAFAILDERRTPARVVVGRDRLGIKPVYWAATEDGAIFASEVRALLATGLVPPRLSAEGFASYVQFGSVIEPNTLVEGVRSLPAGTVTVFTADKPEPVAHAYWSHPTPATSHASLPEATRIVSECFEDAVRAHLVADVPVGVFLSSGVDSTILAGIAARQSPNIRTFTVTFSEEAEDEAAEARASAKRFGTRHLEADVSAEVVRRDVGDYLRAMDQPTIDGVNTYVVSRAARSAGLKVALSGLGADEVFGGYPTFRTVPRLSRARPALVALPTAARRALASLVSLERGAPGAKLAAFVREAEAYPHGYFQVRALFPSDEARALGGGAVSGAWAEEMRASAARAATLPSFHGVSFLESRHYMRSTLLRDSDAMSMANSIEMRPVYLDHPLVETVFALKPEILSRRTPKSLLRGAAGEFLSPTISGQRKRTFTFPWESWLRGDLGDTVRASLADIAGPLRGRLRSEAVSNTLTDFDRRRTTWSRPWALFVLNEWTRSHLEASR